MTVRRLAVLAIAVLGLLVPATASTKKGGEPPNVVVIMTDDQDFRSMSAMPQTRKLIARQGTRFEQAIVNFPLCCPSRATFLSGQYAHNHGVIWNNAPLGGYSKLDGTQTVPVWLQRALLMSSRSRDCSNCSRSPPRPAWRLRFASGGNNWGRASANHSTGDDGSHRLGAVALAHAVDQRVVVVVRLDQLTSGIPSVAP